MEQTRSSSHYMNASSSVGPAQTYETRYSNTATSTGPISQRVNPVVQSFSSSPLAPSTNHVVTTNKSTSGMVSSSRQQTSTSTGYSPAVQTRYVSSSIQEHNMPITTTTNQYVSSPGMSSHYTQTQTNQQLNREGLISYEGQRLVSGNERHSTIMTESNAGERVLSISSHVDDRRATVISERMVEHEIKVPKKIIREDVIEKVIVIPERFVREEVVEDIHRVREKVVEVSKPIIKQKIIEVPQIQYVDKIVEYAEVVLQERIKEVPRIETQERIIEVPRIVTQERIVEVPQIVYRDVPVERIVEVAEIREEIVVKERPVPQYVDVPVAHHVDVQVPFDVERHIPVPVEAVTNFELQMPHLRPVYKKVSYPVYLPRFLEVPVPAELMSAESLARVDQYQQKVSYLPTTAASLCDVETLAANIANEKYSSSYSPQELQDAVLRAWQSGKIQVFSENQQ